MNVNIQTQAEPVPTVEEAREALIDMMRNTNRPAWGGKIKPPDYTKIFELASNDINPDTLPVEYHETPPDIPKIMYETENQEDGKVRIGFWFCDLKERSFSSSEENDAYLNQYEGAFTLDESGKWIAEYWVSLHISKGPVP